MALSPGARLGPYEITARIGVGGMGEVYRAKDTRLPREAAVKVSAERFSERFAGEAKIIASLNHPNISTLYDVGDDYLVMELVEGPTLAERIRLRPLTLDEAAAIARQIVDALDYAHERGVVHRDLKPGNIKIRPDGVVKVLDFGLAKTGVGRTAHTAEATTVAVPHTEVGVVLGTPAYMAPEQTTGQVVDRRADIWAFGCVFYEMLAGAPPHQRDTSQETIASILRDDPDLNKVPARSHRLLKQCLEKDPQKRPRHIGDVMSLLDGPPSGQSSSSIASPVARVADVSAKARKAWLWPVTAGAAALAIGVALVAWAPWKGRTVSLQSVRFEVAQSDGMQFVYGGAMVVSPDGHWLVFPARGEDGVVRYWVRSLETVEARVLPGTEGAFVPAAWTADSRYVVFTPLGGATMTPIKKVDIQGGPPQVLGEMLGAFNGATSSKEGAILFGSSQLRAPVFRVPAAGGAVVPVTVVAEGDVAHRFPQFLPDGRRFLYLRISPDPDKMGVYVGSIDAGPQAQRQDRVLATNRQAYYAPGAVGGPGHLIFLRDGTLMAQPFDPDRLTLNGEAVSIAEGVESYPSQSYGMFSVSDSGTLAYRSGGGEKLSITWFDQKGRLERALGDPGEYANPALSPDGSRIAVAQGKAGARDIWIVDAARNTTQRFTFDPANDDNPVWSPDGTTIAFASNRRGQAQLYLKSADGLGEERLMTDQPGVPTSWSKDGRYLLFTVTSAKTLNDIWVLPEPRRADAKPFELIATESNDEGGQFSPDGRWIAYVAERPSARVYVRPFLPNAGAGAIGARYLVSRGLGLVPRWRADGAQLFFITLAPDLVMAVEVNTRPRFQAGTPERRFTAPPPVGAGWNVAPGGDRFLFVTTADGGKPAPFRVVVNWAAALTR